MPKATPPQKVQSDSKAPLGAVLGTDFEPNPERIVIGPRNDRKKLKIKIKIIDQRKKSKNY